MFLSTYFPALFIPVSKKGGVITCITEYVMERGL